MDGSLAQGLAAGLGTAAVVTGGRWVWMRRTRPGTTDRLTGLASRRVFDSRLAHAQLRARRHGLWVGVMAIDVDDLSAVNAAMGREGGDLVLRDVAAQLTQQARDVDTVARTGSDEFAILFEQVDSPTGVARAARRILDALEQPLTVEGRPVAASVSIGISVNRGGTAPPETLVREAGIALGRAKTRGKRQFEIFEPPAGREAEARLTVEADLRQAIDRDELVVSYQPIVELTTGTMVGAEALMRWEHPDRGLLLPAEFLAEAESSGAIVPLGRFVLDAACRTAAGLGRVPGRETPFRISVNVSPRQFRDGDRLIGDVQAALARHHLPPDALTLEVTESSLLDDLDHATASVRRLRELGVHVVLDDFGTGYSPLSYIRRVPVCGLKIDQPFVDDLANPATAAILRAVVGVARELRISVTAEGIETAEQVERLRSLGCRLAQGRYYCDAVTMGVLARMAGGPALPQQRSGPPAAAPSDGGTSRTTA